MSGAPAAVLFEPHVGGRIYPRAPDGAEHEWGRVTAWEPPGRLAYTWHLRQDAADATDVEITFTAVPGTALRSRSSTPAGSGSARAGPELRERNTRGWTGLLPHFVALAAA